MEKTKKNAQRWLCISLVVMLVCSIAVAAIQTSFGSVKIKKLSWESENGYTMSGWLFVPSNATSESPAPAIVTSHGMYNNLGMQDANFVELSRRGYVVLAQNMPSHGESEPVNNVVEIFSGLYESVKVLGSLPYVDVENIGITGHSLGGMSSNFAVNLDNAAETQLVSAVLLNSADATYTDTNGDWTNIYGTRDVGIIAPQYDEFFFLDKDENGNTTATRDYIKYNNAQSFLYFGTDPVGQDKRSAETIYTQEIDGEDTMRVIYNAPITHPWSHFSSRSTASTIEFFQQSLGAPNPLNSSNQIWNIKEVFNGIGLIAFGIFILSLTVTLVFTAPFASLQSSQVVASRPITKKGKVWFFGGLILSAIFASVSYIPILTAANAHTSANTSVAQTSPWGISLWAAACGVFAIICMVASYIFVGKNEGFDAVAVGLKISVKKLLKTILLAVIVVSAAWLVVFLADYFFMADFRFWVIAVRSFNLTRLVTSLFPYMPLFLVYYIANSVAVNCFNYNIIGVKTNKGHWINTAICAAFSMVAPLVLSAIQYGSFFATGYLAWPNGGNMFCIWLVPMLIILPVAVVISRKIYRVTNNPYLAGIISGIMVTLISCGNTLTWK